MVQAGQRGARRGLGGPALYFGAVVVIVFAAEATVMMVLPHLLSPDASPLTTALCDSTLLTLLTFPLLWRVLIRPLRDATGRTARLHRMMIDRHYDAVLTISASGRITSANPSAIELLGGGKTDLVGQRLDQFVQARDGADLVTSHKLENDAIVTRPDGSKVEVAWSMVELGAGPDQQWMAILRDVTLERELARRLDESHRRLVEASREAGKAEVATGILHNVGNVLNSVGVSVDMLRNQIAGCRIDRLRRAVSLMLEQRDRLAEFVATEEGDQCLALLDAVAAELQQGHAGAVAELGKLSESLRHVKEVVAVQQSVARPISAEESFCVADVVEDAIKTNDAALQRHGVAIERRYDTSATIVADRHRLLQILINLISNAKYSAGAAGDGRGRIVVRVAETDEGVRIDVEDNGVGIERANLDRVFEFGFTTKGSDGHGFGLHSSAIAAQELGATISAYSDGPGKGARFSVCLPVREDAACPV